MKRNLLLKMIVTGMVIIACGISHAGEKVTVAALTFVSSSPLFIAQEQGYFNDEGLEVEFKFFRAVFKKRTMLIRSLAPAFFISSLALLFATTDSSLLNLLAERLLQEPQKSNVEEIIFTGVPQLRISSGSGSQASTQELSQAKAEEYRCTIERIGERY